MQRLQSSLLGSRTLNVDVDASLSLTHPSTPSTSHMSSWSLQNTTLTPSAPPTGSNATLTSPLVDKALWGGARTLDKHSYLHYRCYVLKHDAVSPDASEGYGDLVSLASAVDPGDAGGSTLRWLEGQQRSVMRSFVKGQSGTDGRGAEKTDLREYCEASGVEGWGKVWLAIRSGLVSEAVEALEGMEEERVKRRLVTGKGAVGSGDGTPHRRLGENARVESTS